jgi:cation-transporting ATPase F
MTQTTAQQDWHCLTTDDVVRLLHADEHDGLDLFDVKHRIEKVGPNVITPAKGTPAWLRFLKQFHQPLIYILIAAGVITVFLGDYVDAAVILGVVLVNALIGYIQEARAVSAIEALKQTLQAEATVLRGGEKVRVTADQIVPGDIVLLASGDKVPADLRLLTTRDLQIAEAALTGESVPVEKNAHHVKQETELADRHCMAYASTLVTYGAGTGVAVATGDATEVGQISGLIQSATDLATPLTRKLARFSGILLWVILALAGVTFVVGLLRGYEVVYMFESAVALSVGAIPEGLPAAVTITLAIGVGRMAKRRAIIRKLPAVETLGSTTVICSDKTGTLTQNEMTVRAVMAGGCLYEVSGQGYAPEGEVGHPEGDISDGIFTPGPEAPVAPVAVAAADTADESGAGRAGAHGVMVDSVGGASCPAQPGDNAALREVLIAGVLCNDAGWTKDDSGRWGVQGDPTEGALYVSARKLGLEREALEAATPRLDAIPFESEYQFMATLHAVGSSDERVVYVKGAAEALEPRFETMLDPAGNEVPVDHKALHREVEALARKGLRVLAFARGSRPHGDDDLSHDEVADRLVFLGFQAMIDPPRQEAVDAIAACHTAGIQVKMITGDHKVTAGAIGAQVGLVGADNAAHALSGAELERLSDKELIEVAETTNVFARVTPEQKLRLVEALQARGHVVAMTGDGVNDAPALKQADIGTAMGITGTEVAKEAADMVLTDDDFATIEAAVEEGRGVFANLLKFIAWTLPTNLGEGLVIMVAILFGLTLPITPLQILWINMTTAVLLGLMLAFEPNEPGTMSRPPRDPGKPILTGRIVGRICLVGALLLAGSFGLFELALDAGLSEAAAQTVAVNVFVFVELFYLFNSRSFTRGPVQLGFFSNRNLLYGVGAMILLQLAFTYLPFMQTAFGTEAIPGRSWVWILLVSLAAYIIVEVEKRFGKKAAEGRAA